MVQIYRLIYDVSTEKKGKTVHLLKSNSKPVASAKKRKKIPIQGTYEEYRDSKIKDLGKNAKNAAQSPQVRPMQEDQQVRPMRSQGQSSGGSSIVQYMAPAPGQKDAKM